MGVVNNSNDLPLERGGVEGAPSTNFSAAYLPLLAPWLEPRSQARQVKNLQKEIFLEGRPPPSLPRSAGEGPLRTSPGLVKVLEWLLSKKPTLVKGQGWGPIFCLYCLPWLPALGMRPRIDPNPSLLAYSIDEWKRILCPPLLAR